MFRTKHWKIHNLYSSNRKKEFTRIDKNEEEITKNIPYRSQFIKSARFLARSLWNFVNNLSEGIYKIKCQPIHNNKKYEACGIKYKTCACFLEYSNFKDDLIE